MDSSLTTGRCHNHHSRMRIKEVVEGGVVWVGEVVHVGEGHCVVDSYRLLLLL